MADRVYLDWVTTVQRAGGVVGTFPGTNKVAAKYPSSVWGPKSNARAWPLPDKMVSHPDATKEIEYAPGKFTPSLGYYIAPDAVQRAAATLSDPTDREQKVNAEKLMAQWGIPFAFRDVKNILAILLIAGATLYYVKQKSRSQGPRA